MYGDMEGHAFDVLASFEEGSTRGPGPPGERDVGEALAAACVVYQ